MQTQAKKIALVTGASKGLGAAIAAKLVKAGYFVILNARGRHELENVKRSLESGSAEILQADVSQKNFPSVFDKFMKRRKLPRLDLVIHSAGINHMGTIRETRIENAEVTFRVNAHSVITLAAATRAYLERADSPRFVLVSSLMQYFWMPGRSIYAASKAAAEYFAGAWAHELYAEKSNIRVQIFRPAGIQTDFHGNTKTDGVSPRSDISRMSPEKVADYLFRFVHSNAFEMAPGAMNKIVAFVTRHFPRFAGYLSRRRYLRRITASAK